MQAMARLIVPPTAAVASDVARIDALWQDCRARYSNEGPWLFGRYCIADAMYAPIVLRFNTYGPKLSAVANAYMQQTMSDPHMLEWLRDAQREVGAG